MKQVIATRIQGTVYFAWAYLSYSGDKWTVRLIADKPMTEADARAVMPDNHTLHHHPVVGWYAKPFNTTE